MATNEEGDSTRQNGDIKQPIFRNLDASDVQELETTVIDSLCMQCEEEGITRLLLTKIPLFKEVIISSFHCPHCGNSNNEIMDGSTMPDEGVKYTLQVNTQEDLNCMMVKANSASLLIPELEFEIPPKTQRGSINTLEGFLTLSLNELEKDQPIRKSLYPEVYEKLENFITKLKMLLEVKAPFVIVLDDPSGNSFVENTIASKENPNLRVEHYTRTAQQDAELGIISATQSESTNEPSTTDNNSIDKDEVLAFQDTCCNCNNSVETRMKAVDIPHFKQVILMSFVCEFCGHKSNEVKSGSGISELGTKMTLCLTNQFDLSRDILKAATASLRIPELDFELEPGTLGGRFTTVEGILVSIKDQLSGYNVFSAGDSATKDDKMAIFLKRLQKIIDGEWFGVHIIMDDPSGNSYLQNLYAPEKDPELEIEYYTRTLQQDEELGIDQLKTED